MLPFFIFLPQKMNIAIIGYGKMGKEIERLALPEHNIVCFIDINNQEDIKLLRKKNVDVAIEFTTPQSAVQNIISCFEQEIPVVCGTTGWHDKLEYIKNECNKYKGALLYSTNFSIGVNLYFHLVKQSAKIFNSYFQKYHLTIEEIHHTQKKDSPSGTAITMANIVMNEIQEIENWVNYLETLPETLNKKEIPIISKRIENVIGTHKLSYESDIDILTIEHKAKNRQGFAIGAITAAQFIKDKKGIYTMNDLLKINT